MNQEVAIITYSCDRNSAMWEIMMTFMKKYWHDCPYKQVLLTDKDSEGKGIKAGFDQVIEYDSTWADMHRHALEVLDVPYFMMWMDDLFLYEHVDTGEVERLVRKASERQALCLYLIKTLLTKQTDDVDFDLVEPGKAYCFTSNCGIWDSKMFMNVVDHQWSAWDFERIGSVTVHDLPGELLVSKNYQMKWDEGIFRGKWLPRGIELCQKEGIDISKTGKPCFSKKEMAVIEIQGKIMKMAPNFITKVKNMTDSWRGA